MPPGYLSCAPATWPASQTHWREVCSRAGSLKPPLLDGGPEGGPWKPKAVSSQHFRLSRISVGALCRCSLWEAPGPGPPSGVLFSSVRSAPRLSSQFGFPALAKAAWRVFLRRSAKLPGALLVNLHNRGLPLLSPGAGGMGEGGGWGVGFSLHPNQVSRSPSGANLTLSPSPPLLPQTF